MNNTRLDDRTLMEPPDIKDTDINGRRTSDTLSCQDVVAALETDGDGSVTDGLLKDSPGRAKLSVKVVPFTGEQHHGGSGKAGWNKLAKAVHTRLDHQTSGQRSETI